MNDDWISVREAAQFGEFHENHIRRLAREGAIVGRKVGRRMEISRLSLQDYLDGVNVFQKRGPQPGA